MQIYKEGAVINPLRRKNHKVKHNPEYIATDDTCVAFLPGDVITTYGTDWSCNTRAEAFKEACHVMQNIMHLAEEDIIDFNVIETYCANEETGYYSYELRITTSMEVADTLQDYYKYD